MNTTRLIRVLMIGSLLLASSAFAAEAAKPAATSAATLSKDQVSAIQKDCSKANAGSMTSKAYLDCVKTKETAAMAHGTAH